MIPNPLQQRAEVAAATGRDTLAVVLGLRDLANAIRGDVDAVDMPAPAFPTPLRDPTNLGISTRSGARRATRKP